MVLKKIFAILFINVYLFNLAGYSILFDYFIQQANKQTVQHLDDSNYNEAELIEIKIQMHLPYYYSWNDYERIDGEIELNGIHYNFVKRKICNDTLYMLCLPNQIKTELHKAKNEFAAKESDNDASSKKGAGSLNKKNNFETEYNWHAFQYNVLQIAGHTRQQTIFSSRLNSCFIAFPVQPPEIIA